MLGDFRGQIVLGHRGHPVEVDLNIRKWHNDQESDLQNDQELPRLRDFTIILF